MADRLSDYRKKRDLDSTPEPDGGSEAGSGGRFVIQQHHATSLHWDLRLEHDGTLASWALPRGVPQHPKENRLAVHTEDHPLEYLDFHGEIPEGAYGAGTMGIWDHGTFDEEKFRDDEVIVVLHGERVEGKYVLFHTKGKNWMIHRMDPAPGGVEPMPDTVKPMFAKLGELPGNEDGWAFEVKWDGVRAVATADHGRLELTGRNGTDFTPRYPELRGLAYQLGARRAILDGEVVALDSRGRPSFEALQARMHLTSKTQIARRARDSPVTYIAFDLLWLEGHSTLGLSYEDRRSLLDELDVTGPHWRTPAYREGDGAALLEASAAQKLEGIVAKRLDATYEPGRRSGAWIKIKNRPSQDVVVGGWLPGEGGRAATLGALAVGVRAEPGGPLKYAGRVGSGFTDATLKTTVAALEPLRTEESPFDGRQPPKETVFVEPQLVAHVEFGEWTRTGTLRAPVFRGLRNDADASVVIREEG